MGKYFDTDERKYGITKKYFTKQSVEDKIGDYESGLKSIGTTPPPAAERGTWSRIMDLLNVGTASAANVAIEKERYLKERGMDVESSVDQDAGTTFKNWGSMLTDPEYYSRIGNAAWQGLKSNNPFGAGNPEYAKSTVDVMKEYYGDAGDYNSLTDENGEYGLYSAANVGKNVLKFITNTFSDVITSPASLLDAPVAAFLRGTGRTLAKSSAKELGKETFEQGIEKLLGSEGKNILSEFGQDATDELVESLANKTRRVAGYEPKVGYAKLRELGDKSKIAPAINTALDYIGKSDVGQGAQKLFKSKESLDSAKEARANPEQYFKSQAFKLWNKDQHKAFSELQKQFKTNAESLFEGLSDDTINTMSDLMEQPNMFNDATKVVGVKGDIKNTPKAQVMLDKLSGVKNEVETMLVKYKELNLTNQQIGNYKNILKSVNGVLRSNKSAYGDLIDLKSVKNLSQLRELKNSNPDELNEFVNQFVNDDPSVIAEKLGKLGYTDSQASAHEIRAIVDNATKSMNPYERKYFTGQKGVKPVKGFVVGRPYTEAADSVYRDWYKKYQDFITNNLGGKSAEIKPLDITRSEFVKANEKNMSSDDFLAIQKIFADEDKLSKYIDETNTRNGEVKMEEMRQNIQNKKKQYDVENKVLQEKRNKINTIIETRLKHFTDKTLNSDQLFDLRNKWKNSLNQLSDAEIEKRFSKATRYDAMEANKFPYKNNQEELAKKLASIYVGNAKLTSKQGNKNAYQDFFASLMKKPYEELRQIERQLQQERHATKANVGYDVDSGTARKVADKIETERYNEGLSAQYDRSYAGLDEDGLIADNYLDDVEAFTDASKNIDWKGEQGAYFKTKQDVKFDTNFENKATTHNEFNYNGTIINEPVGSPQNAKASDVFSGIDNIARTNPKLANYVGQLKVQLSDVDSWAQAFTGDKKIVVSGNATADVAKHIMPHEVAHNFGKQVSDLLWKDNDISTWNKAAMTDKNPLLKGTKMFENGMSYKMAHEDFAESFAKYVNDPFAFSKEFPNRFNAMQRALNDFKVPEATVNRLDAKYFKLPKTAKESASDLLKNNQRAAAMLKNEIDNLNINNVSEAEYIAKHDELSKLTDNSGFNPEFEKVFKQHFPDEDMREYVTENVTKEFKVASDKLTQRVNKFEPEQRDKISKALEEMKNNLEKWGDEETADKIPNYFPHMQRANTEVSEAIKKAKSEGKYTLDNPYLKERQHKGTIHSINAKMREKLGVDFDLFETNAAKVYVARGLDHNKFVFQNNFYNKLIDTMGTKIDDARQILNNTLYVSKEDVMKSFKELKGIADMTSDELQEVATKHGLPKDFFTSKTPIVQINADTFTRLKGLKSDFSAFTVSDNVANEVNKMGMVQIDEMESITKNIYDKFLRTIKTSQTALNPGFHIGNWTSNHFQNFLNVGSLAIDPRIKYSAGKLLSDDEAYLKNTKINTKYGEKTLFEVKEWMDKLDVANGGRIINETSEIDPSKMNVFDKLTQGANQKGLQLRDVDGKIDWNIVNPLSQIFDAKHPLDTFKKSDSTFSHNQNLLVQAGQIAGSRVENNARATNFLANIMQGKDYYEATENVNKFLFDYSDLSVFEQNVMKRIIPFYTWMRKNIPLQVEQLIEQPNTYRIAGKAQNAIEQSVPEDQRIKDEDKNKFAQDWIQMPLNVTGKSEKQEPMFYNPRMPYQDLSKLSANPVDVGQTIMSSMSPYMKIPAELVMNYNTFFGTPISRGIGDSDDAPGYLQALLGGTKENPAQMDPKLRYALRNIGFLENISKLTDVKNSNEETMLAALKFFGGQSLYSYDVEKYKKWAHRDRLKQLRDLYNSEIEKRQR